MRPRGGASHPSKLLCNAPAMCYPMRVKTYLPIGILMEKESRK